MYRLKENSKLFCDLQFFINNLNPKLMLKLLDSGSEKKKLIISEAQHCRGGGWIHALLD
jgi:hypothetical protein